MESISQIFAELGDDRPDFAEALADAYTALTEASWLLADKGLNLEALNAALNDIAEINQAIADAEIESFQDSRNYPQGLAELIRDSFTKEVA